MDLFNVAAHLKVCGNYIPQIFVLFPSCLWFVCVCATKRRGVLSILTWFGCVVDMWTTRRRRPILGCRCRHWQVAQSFFRNIQAFSASDRLVLEWIFRFRKMEKHLRCLFFHLLALSVCMRCVLCVTGNINYIARRYAYWEFDVSVCAVYVCIALAFCTHSLILNKHAGPFLGLYSDTDTSHKRIQLDCKLLGMHSASCICVCVHFETSSLCRSFTRINLLFRNFPSIQQQQQLCKFPAEQRMDKMPFQWLRLSAAHTQTSLCRDWTTTLYMKGTIYTPLHGWAMRKQNLFPHTEYEAIRQTACCMQHIYDVTNSPINSVLCTYLNK